MDRSLRDPDHPINFAQLPATWVVVPVGDAIFDVVTGFSSGEHNTTGRGVPHLRPNNISADGHIVLDEVKYVAADRDLLRVSRGDVLFNNTNSAELVGKCAPVEVDADWAFSNHLTRLRPPSGLSYRYVAYQLQMLFVVGYFRHRAKQYVNQASISARTLAHSVPLIIAPSEEQLRIVAEIDDQLGRWDESAGFLKDARAKLEPLRRLTLKNAAEGKLVPTEAELAAHNQRVYESGRELLSQLQAAAVKEGRYRARREEAGGPAPLAEEQSSKLGAPDEGMGPAQTLPEGWVWATVGDLGEVRLGRQRSPEHQYGEHMREYLRVANVFEDRIDTSNLLRMNFTPQEYEVYRLEAGDILLNEGQSPELVGRPAMFRNEVRGACFQNTLIRFRAYSGVSPGFALLVFRHYLHSGRFRQIARGSTNIAHLGAARFAELDFPLPPLAEQERIVVEAERVLSEIDGTAEMIAAALGRISNLRFGLLRSAFSGELLPQEPSDTATALLLARIQEERSHAIVVAKQLRQTRARSRMKNRKVARRPLIEVLDENGGRLPAEELLRRSGIGEDLIEDFFEELRREHNAGRIQEDRSSPDRAVYLQLVRAS
jgi:type I restriction enzyme S subunit